MFAVREDDGSGESVTGAALSRRIVHPIVGSARRIDQITVASANGWRVQRGGSGGGILAGLRAPVFWPVALLVVTLGAVSVTVSVAVSVDVSLVLLVVGITSGRSWGAGPLRQGVPPPRGESLRGELDGVGRGAGGRFLPPPLADHLPLSDVRRQPEPSAR